MTLGDGLGTVNESFFDVKFTDIVGLTDAFGEIEGMVSPDRSITVFETIKLVLDMPLGESQSRTNKRKVVPQKKQAIIHGRR